MKKIELNTNLVPLFRGTYESMWEIEEQEYRTEYDFKEFMQSIADEYENQSLNIKQALGIDWIKKITFTGGYNSPREYNFSTDTLDFIIEINQSGMLRQLKSLEDDKEFNTWLYDNYTSRDGFWSYTPNNYQDLKQAIISENDEYHQAIGALIQWIARDAINNNEYYNGIEYAVYDSWQGNGYGNINYTIHCDNHDTEVNYDENEGDLVCIGCKAEKERSITL